MRDNKGRKVGGQDLIEFALVTPLLLTVVLVLAEFAVVIFRYNAVASAARQGARRGIVVQGTVAQVQAAAVSGVEDAVRASGLNSEDLTVVVPAEAIANGRVEVQVIYRAALLTQPVIRAIGIDSGGQFTLRATSSMIRE